MLNVGGPTANVGGPSPTANDLDANILVTASFVKMLQRILLLRSDVLHQRIDAQGVVITGQPGIGKLYLPSSLFPSNSIRTSDKFTNICICMCLMRLYVGKTTFLKFLLAQLLASHQVVLLVSSTTSHLFFQGKIYVRRSDSDQHEHEHMPYTGFHFLPAHTHRTLHPYPIWALINVDADDNSPDSAIAIPTNCNVWPIMVCPPDGPARYGCWRKQRRGCLWGMGGWREGEVRAGWVPFPSFFFLNAS